MSHNVPVVYDVARPPLKQCVALRGRAMWVRENATKGVSPTGVFRTLAASRRRTYTILLDEVKPATKRPPWTAGVPIFIPFFFRTFFQMLFLNFHQNHIFHKKYDFPFCYSYFAIRFYNSYVIDRISMPYL